MKPDWQFYDLGRDREVIEATVWSGWIYMLSRYMNRGNMVDVVVVRISQGF